MRPLIATCLLLFLSSISWASTYVIEPDGTGDFPTIQPAIVACVAGDVIQLTDGTFTGVGNRNITFLGKGLVVESMNGNPELCIIDIQDGPVLPHRGFLFNSGEGPDAILRNVTIRDGYATSALPGGAHGGGCLIEGGSSPTLDGCVFEQNTATSDGGAISISEQSSPNVTRCEFRWNQAHNAGGAGDISEGSQPTFEDCDFIENSAPNCGGIFVISPLSVGTFENCRFTRNVSTSASTSSGAGALWAGSAGTASLIDCVFDGNEAQHVGGAICVGHPQATSGTVIAERCLFIRNHADLSGGVILTTSGGGASLTECSFLFNTAGVSAAVARAGAGESISLVSCTLAGNASPGATLESVYTDSQIVLENTIVAFSTQGAAANGVGNFSVTCCDIYSNAGGDYVGPIAGLLGVDGNISENPWFCDTPNQDYHIVDYSACAPEHSGCGLIGAWPVNCLTVGIPVQAGMPAGRMLEQNRPNPFNPSTAIAFTLPEAGLVTLEIHDVAGRLVRVLAPSAVVAPGRHELRWDGRDDRGQQVSSGIYFYRIEVGEWSETRPMVLVR